MEVTSHVRSHPTNYERCGVSVFAVHISNPDPEPVAKAIKREYPEPNHFPVSERFFLVSADTLARAVGETLGFDADGLKGTVFKLNAAHYGFDRRDMWEWLETARQSG